MTGIAESDLAHFLPDPTITNNKPHTKIVMTNCDMTGMTTCHDQHDWHDMTGMTSCHDQPDLLCAWDLKERNYM